MTMCTYNIGCYRLLISSYRRSKTPADESCSACSPAARIRAAIVEAFFAQRMDYLVMRYTLEWVGNNIK